MPKKRKELKPSAYWLAKKLLKEKFGPTVLIGPAGLGKLVNRWNDSFKSPTRPRLPPPLTPPPIFGTYDEIFRWSAERQTQLDQLKIDPKDKAAADDFVAQIKTLAAFKHPIETMETSIKWYVPPEKQ